METAMMATIESLSFELPAELEAREPPEARGLRRDEVRLLVTTRKGEIAHAHFFELPDFLQRGDLLVANDSATIPAALTAETGSGEVIDLHLSTHLDSGLWVVELRAEGLAAGELTLPGGASAELLEPYAGSRRLWLASLDLRDPDLAYLGRWGRPIGYAYLKQQWPLDMYQTVYARVPGSAEMPSAGRPFSKAVLARLAARGIGFVTLTLHTGVSSLEEPERPYDEPFSVPEEAANAVAEARAAGGRVIAVGTTAVRALETAARHDGRVRASKGWTDLVITPERGVRVVDGLLTGFHEPKSSHLAMLEAIAGLGLLERSYEAAIKGGYLWHEFGDVHLLLP
jgi:S-adenosylmethionine:tRNA ribosyltransferase-isomerase